MRQTGDEEESKVTRASGEDVRSGDFVEVGEGLSPRLVRLRQFVLQLL